MFSKYVIKIPRLDEMLCYQNCTCVSYLHYILCPAAVMICIDISSVRGSYLEY